MVTQPLDTLMFLCVWDMNVFRCQLWATPSSSVIQTSPPWNAATWKRLVSSHLKIALNHSTGFPLQDGSVTAGFPNSADQTIPGSLLHQGGWKPGHFHWNLENHLNLLHLSILPTCSSPSLGWFLHAHLNLPTSLPYLTLLHHPPSVN